MIGSLYFDLFKKSIVDIGSLKKVNDIITFNQHIIPNVINTMIIQLHIWKPTVAQWLKA